MTNRQPQQIAKYQIKVDLETCNIAGGEPNCRSPMHARHGRHYDITIHSFPSRCRSGRGARRPPTRYWDDNSRQGYTLKGVVTQARVIIGQEPKPMDRRCRKCNVPPHPPDWD